MLDLLVALARTVCTGLGLGVLGFGAWVIVTDRPLNTERSTRSGDTPRHGEPDELAPPD